MNSFRSSYLCTKGDSCKWYKRGKCKFIHPTKSAKSTKSTKSTGPTKQITYTKIDDIETRRIAIYENIKMLSMPLTCSQYCFTDDMVNIAVPKIIKSAFEPLLMNKYLVQNVVSIILQYTPTISIQKCVMPMCINCVSIPDYTTVNADELYLLPVICDKHDVCSYCNGYCEGCNWFYMRSDESKSIIFKSCVASSECDMSCKCYLSYEESGELDDFDRYIEIY
ncbi:MAG: hypothetical protein Faunusvirus11_6 [Faunusvirus sp.]|jgi:hypothetical protein|uniref:Uncharacterized protein n=1 Tax=Faunusvirus sp. TaxID=2487766 RepID=A0A3G4ZWT4_9VIRU|nr:MAG: hypothetical protein Faunusvirus11_6 [Faunusvirus sp.]